MRFQNGKGNQLLPESLRNRFSGIFFTFFSRRFAYKDEIPINAKKLPSRQLFYQLDRFLLELRTFHPVKDIRPGKLGQHIPVLVTKSGMSPDSVCAFCTSGESRSVNPVR